MTSYPGRPGTRNCLFGPGLSPERQISAVPPATYCFGGRERRCRKLRNRRSARAAACPSVSVRYPELLSDRARSRHGVDPQRMTAAPCRGWPASGSGQAPDWPLGFWPEEVQRLRRSRVAGGHFRRKREAPLTVERHPRTLSGPSPDAQALPRLCTFLPLASLWTRGHRQAGQLR